MKAAGYPVEAKRVHYAWIVAGLTCLALLTVAGVRSSFGVFVQPLQHEFGGDRSAISITAVLSMLLYGALGPLAGGWRIGTGRAGSLWSACSWRGSVPWRRAPCPGFGNSISITA